MFEAFEVAEKVEEFEAAVDCGALALVAQFDPIVSTVTEDGWRDRLVYEVDAAQLPEGVDSISIEVTGDDDYNGLPDSHLRRPRIAYAVHIGYGVKGWSQFVTEWSPDPMNLTGDSLTAVIFRHLPELGSGPRDLEARLVKAWAEMREDLRREFVAEALECEEFESAEAAGLAWDARNAVIEEG